MSPEAGLIRCLLFIQCHAIKNLIFDLINREINIVPRANFVSFGSLIVTMPGSYTDVGSTYFTSSLCSFKLSTEESDNWPELRSNRRYRPASSKQSGDHQASQPSTMCAVNSNREGLEKQQFDLKQKQTDWPIIQYCKAQQRIGLKILNCQMDIWVSIILL